MEKKLISNKFFFEKEIFNNFQSIIIILDKNKKIIFINEFGLNIFKLISLEIFDLININYQKALPTKLVTKLKTSFAEINKNHKKFRIDNIELLPNLILGLTIMPLLEKIEKEKSRINKLTGYLITGQNITEIILKEKNLIFNNLIIESISNPLFSVNTNSELIYINDPAKEIFELKNKKISKIKIEHAFNDFLSSIIKKCINNIHKTKQKIRIESIDLSTPEKPKFIGFTAYPVIKEQKIIGYVFSGKDITSIILEEKRKEEYLKEVNKLILASTALSKSKYQEESIKSVMNREDELGLLAREFDKMAKERIKKEEKLKKEMQHLRSLIIDEKQKQADVKEIIDTKFFQDLKKRSKNLRARIFN